MVLSSHVTCFWMAKWLLLLNVLWMILCLWLSHYIICDCIYIIIGIKMSRIRIIPQFWMMILISPRHDHISFKVHIVYFIQTVWTIIRNVNEFSFVIFHLFNKLWINSECVAFMHLGPSVLLYLVFSFKVSSIVPQV